MINYFDMFITVSFLLLLAVPGFIFAKIKMFPKTASETLTVIGIFYAVMFYCPNMARDLFVKKACW